MIRLTLCVPQRPDCRGKRLLECPLQLIKEMDRCKYVPYDPILRDDQVTRHHGKQYKRQSHDHDITQIAKAGGKPLSMSMQTGKTTWLG